MSKMSWFSSKLRSISEHGSVSSVSSFLKKADDLEPVYCGGSSIASSMSTNSNVSDITVISPKEFSSSKIQGVNIQQSKNFHIGDTTKIYLIEKFYSSKNTNEVIKEPEEPNKIKTTSQNEVILDVDDLSERPTSSDCTIEMDCVDPDAKSEVLKEILVPKKHWSMSSTRYWSIWLLVLMISLSSIIAVSLTYTYAEEPIVSVLLNEFLVQRSEWNAKEPNFKVKNMQLPAGRVIISQTGTAECITKVSCVQMVREIQCKNMFYDDIVYNFLIGGDGSVYEGRGWDVRGEHTYGHNEAIGIAFIGNFRDTPPSELQTDAFNMLMEIGKNQMMIYDGANIDLFYDNRSNQDSQVITNIGESLKKILIPI